MKSPKRVGFVSVHDNNRHVFSKFRADLFTKFLGYLLSVFEGKRDIGLGQVASVNGTL